MLLLALDTSSPITSCALLEDDKVLASSLRAEKAGDLLPAELQRLCEEAGKTLRDVQGIAAGIGPGSFTGLRVGLASAKGLAYALKIPIASASSLLALSRSSEGLVCACLEARKGELFVRLDRDGTEVWPEQVLKAAELPAKLHGLGAQVLGPGTPPPAAEIARLCLPALRGARYDEAACFALSPNYLQPATAETALAEGRVGKL